MLLCVLQRHSEARQAKQQAGRRGRHSGVRCCCFLDWDEGSVSNLQSVEEWQGVLFIWPLHSPATRKSRVNLAAQQIIYVLFSETSPVTITACEVMSSCSPCFKIRVFNVCTCDDIRDWHWEQLRIKERGRFRGAISKLAPWFLLWAFWCRPTSASYCQLMSGFSLWQKVTL